jgi:archaellum biogenesis protein FlaJ (TadC family)
VAFVTGLLGAVVAILVIWFSPVRHIRDAPTTITIGGTGITLPGDESPLP